MAENEVWAYGADGDVSLGALDPNAPDPVIGNAVGSLGFDDPDDPEGEYNASWSEEAHEPPDPVEPTGALELQTEI